MMMAIAESDLPPALVDLRPIVRRSAFTRLIRTWHEAACERDARGRFGRGIGSPTG